MNEIGMKIKILRKSKDLTQQELATKMGVSQRTISDWEVGRNNIPVIKLQRMSEIFGTGAAYFFLEQNTAKSCRNDERKKSIEEVKTIGSILREARIGKKIGQEEFAECVGVSRTTLWMWEKDRSKVPAKKLLLMMKALELGLVPADFKGANKCG